MKPSTLYGMVSILLLADTAASVVLGYEKRGEVSTFPTNVPFAHKRTINEGVFQQYIDHSNPSLGTFSQRFWWDDEYYAGPGSPVVMYNPGETAGDGFSYFFAANISIMGLYAQAIGGAGVIIEHRYWGESSPYTDLTTKNLQYLTLENAMKDMVNFAENVQLPFDVSGASHPSKAPWVLTGGSYSGALAAWINAVYPGTFWAYHASSAPVQAITDFYGYYEPMQQGMPKNCTTDIEKVMDHVDQVFDRGSQTEQQALKDQFGLGALSHNDDFAKAITLPLLDWQSQSFGGPYSVSYEFCDAIENLSPGSNSTAPGQDGVGLEKAIAGYAKWINEKVIPGGCSRFDGFPGQYNVGCFDTHNASSSIYTDVSVGGSFATVRQWQWLLCSEPFNWWRVGAPKGSPTLASRLIDSAYWERQCGLYFPEEDGFTYKNGKTTDDVNSFTGGWNYVNTTRLLWMIGEFDPWRSATVLSDFRPGGPLQSTPEAPVLMIPNATHFYDLYTGFNGKSNQEAKRLFEAAAGIMKGWVDDFYTSKEQRL